MTDIPGGPATTASMILGETFGSTIDFNDDKDWIRVTLTKGDRVQFDLAGTGAQGLGDPFLRLYDSNQSLVAENDDGPFGLESRITTLVPRSGTYYLEAGGLSAFDTGDYQISSRKLIPPKAYDPIVWGTQMPDGVISVYFAPAGVQLDGYTSEGFNAYERAQFREAFDRIEAVTDLRFVFTTDRNADFRLVLDTNEMRFEEDSILGQFNPPGSAGALSGVGVFNGFAWDRTAGGDLEAGGIGFVTITHEILHGLGLAHPHDDGGGSSIMPGVTSEFDDYGTHDLNQGIFTTMSYNSGYLTGGVGALPSRFGSYGHEAGPMALDIAALQSIYGRGGPHKQFDSLYWLPGRNTDGTRWETIWDTGGADEIRYDGARDATIDLRMASLVNAPGGGGFVSSVQGIAGGYTIANGAVIENARGGFGDDRLTGNFTDNQMFGRGGADVLRGGLGNDELVGGNGADLLDGGQGRDILRGGDGNDWIVGKAEADRLTGWAGADRFVFQNTAQSLPGPGRRDIITDFGMGDDRIVLRQIDADWTVAGNQAFEFVGYRPFTDAGQVRIAVSGPDRVVQADQNGDGRVDFAILLIGRGLVTPDDFIL